jgi:hypothetical protein
MKVETSPTTNDQTVKENAMTTTETINSNPDAPHTAFTAEIDDLCVVGFIRTNPITGAEVFSVREISGKFTDVQLDEIRNGAEYLHSMHHALGLTTKHLIKIAIVARYGFEFAGIASGKIN